MIDACLILCFCTESNQKHFILGSKHRVVAYTERSQIKHENRHIQLVREYGFHPRTKASVEDGALLPRKYEPFPQNMYGLPLEEIDSFIYEEVSTFSLLIIFEIFSILSLSVKITYLYHDHCVKIFHTFTPIHQLNVYQGNVIFLFFAYTKYRMLYNMLHEKVVNENRIFNRKSLNN